MDEQPEFQSQPASLEGAQPVAPKRRRGRPRNKIMEHTVATFGMSRSVAYRLRRVGARIDEGTLRELDALKVTGMYTKLIAEIADQSSRQAVIALIRQGVHPKRALGLVLKPANGWLRLSNGQVVDVESEPGEEKLSDEQWLDAVCGAVRKQLSDTALFDQEALAYRKNRYAHATFASASERAILRTLKPGEGLGPYTRKLYGLYCVSHPKRWKVCTHCAGDGWTFERDFDEQQAVTCEQCDGAGFRITDDQPSASPDSD